MQLLFSISFESHEVVMMLTYKHTAHKWPLVQELGKHLKGKKEGLWIMNVKSPVTWQTSLWSDITYCFLCAGTKTEMRAAKRQEYVLTSDIFFFLNLNFSSLWNNTGTILYKELCIVTKTVLTSRNKTNFMPIKAQELGITTLPVYLAYIINLICIHWVNCAYGNTVCHAGIGQSLITWLELFLI